MNIRILLAFVLTAFVTVTSSVDAATITGTAVYDGKVPKFREIKMDADPVCVTHHSEKIFPETLVLGECQTMGNVFVRIVGGLAKK